MSNLLTTEEFWEKMGDARFIRTGPNAGMIGEDHYEVKVSPELTPYFISSKVAEVTGALGAHVKQPWWKRILG